MEVFQGFYARYYDKIKVFEGKVALIMRLLLNDSRCIAYSYIKKKTG